MTEESQSAEQIRALIENGTPSLAERELKTLLLRQPDNITLQRLLALSLEKQGRFPEAESQFESILERMGADPICSLDYAEILFEKKRFQRAAQVLEASLRLHPNLSPARYLLADTYYELNEIGKSAENFLAAEELDPFRVQISESKRPSTLEDPARLKRIYLHILEQDNLHVLSLCGLAMIELAERKYFSASKRFEQAMTVTRHYPVLMLGIAHLKSISGHFIEAREYARKALVVFSDDISAWNLFGTISIKLRFFEDAKRCFENSLKLEPRQLAARLSLARCLINSGENNLAGEIYYSLLDDETYPASAWYLSRTENFHLNDQRISVLENCSKDNNSSEHEKQAARCALGAYYHQNELYDRSFECWLDRDNRSLQIPYSSSNYAKRLELLLRDGGPDPNRLQGDGPSDDQDIRIFILGLPGSGVGVLHNFFERICNTGKVVDHGIFEFIENEYNERFSSNVSFAEESINWNQPTLSGIRKEYLKIVNQFSSSESVSIDGTLENFLYVGLILRLFPNARFVDFRRSFWDQLIALLAVPSILRTSITEDIHALHSFLCDYHRVMNHWHSVAGKNFVTIRLEDWYNSPSTTVGTLMEYCKLTPTKEVRHTKMELYGAHHEIFEGPKSCGLSGAYLDLIKEVEPKLYTVW